MRVDHAEAARKTGPAGVSTRKMQAKIVRMLSMETGIQPQTENAGLMSSK